MESRGGAFKKTWITGAVFVAGLVVLALILMLIDSTAVENARDKAKLNAENKTIELTNALDEGAEITNFMGVLIQQGDERSLNDFDALAKDLMATRDYVASVQLAPNGVVNKIYPLEGNEAGMIDLFADSTRGPICEYGRDTAKVTMQGPFNLKQGGQGIAVRDPVFVTATNGQREFWGFTVVIIKVPEVFKQSVDSLTSFGYEYALYKTNPLSSDFMLVDKSDGDVQQPEVSSFTEGESSWKLEVMPSHGWGMGRSLIPYALMGLVIVLLLTALVYSMLILSADKKMFSELSMRDALTGLFNRRAFGEAAKRVDKSGKGYSVIYLDVNRFKQVNDTYGHKVGNDVLVETALRLQSATRYEAYRLGGDEFAILVTDSVTEQDCEAFATNIRRGFEKPILSGKNSLDVRLSIGYARAPEEADDPETLREVADKRMYEDKAKSRSAE